VRYTVLYRISYMKTKAQTNLARFGRLAVRRGESKHSAVFRVLESGIRRMRHGERLPVVRDLMGSFKVSQSTIDHAIARLEARQLVTRRWGSGIYVNRKEPCKTAHRIIGVVVPDITDPFCALLVKGIEKELAAKNHHLILCNGQEQFRRELDSINIMENKIDGVIIHPTTSNVHNPAYVRYFAKLSQRGEMPFLLVDIMVPGVNAPYIGFDNFNAFFQMANVIADSMSNFRQILYLGALDNIIGSERISGFKAGLKERNVPDEMFKIINIRAPGLDIPLSRNDIGGKGRTLIVSASPLIMPKLLSFCAMHKVRIPEDIIVAGVLEENFRDYIHIPILGWVKPSLKLGKFSAQLIQALIAGNPVKQITKLALEMHFPQVLRRFFSFPSSPNDCHLAQI